LNHAVTLIAHRGLPERYPENSLAGIEAALIAGAEYIEVDIQFSSDCIPFLYHDENMLRMSGADQSILLTPAAEICRIKQNYPTNSSLDVKQEPIATLEQLVSLISQWPDCRFFLELKRHSVERFGAATCAREILSVTKPVSAACIPISFHFDAVREFQNMQDTRVGWIIREWNKEHHRLADELSPDFLFCNIKKIPQDPTKLWLGSWQWVLYSVDDMDRLKQLRQGG